MKKELLFSGIGGQGIMNLGEILCAAAIKAGYNVTFSPVYGAEKRGGRTMCNIVISTGIECQVVSEADVMLIMDEASLQDYQHLAGSQGVLILNAQVSTVPDCSCRNIKTVPFIEKAMELGNAKVAKMCIRDRKKEKKDYEEAIEDSGYLADTLPDSFRLWRRLQFRLW